MRHTEGVHSPPKIVQDPRTVTYLNVAAHTRTYGSLSKSRHLHPSKKIKWTPHISSSINVDSYMCIYSKFFYQLRHPHHLYHPDHLHHPHNSHLRHHSHRPEHWHRPHHSHHHHHPITTYLTHTTNPIWVVTTRIILPTPMASIWYSCCHLCHLGHLWLRPFHLKVVKAQHYVVAGAIWIAYGELLLLLTKQ